MATRTINLSLYRSIIQSDFLLLQNLKLKPNFYVLHNLANTKKTNLSVLNITELLKSLKQKRLKV